MKYTLRTTLLIVVFSLILMPFFNVEAEVFVDSLISEVDMNDVSIEWRTNVPSRGRVDYGTDTSYGSTVNTGLSYRNNQAVFIGNLKAKTIYHYRVVAFSDLGEEASTFDRTFKTGSARRTDYDAPEIFDVSLIYYTDREAFVVWRTDEKADSVIRYGVGTQLNKKVTNKGLLTYHLLKLCGLSRGTLYSYSITSKDKVGNWNETAVMQFRTLLDSGTRNDRLEIQTLRPLSTSDPALTEQRATVSWRTNKPATTEVSWGTRTKYSEKYSSSEKVYEHSLDLENLDPSTTYHFRVKSKDIFGKTVDSGDMVFTTRGSVFNTSAGPVQVLAASTGVGGPNTHTTAITSLYRAAENPRVYAMMNGQKHWLRSPAVFNSYGLRYTDVEIVPQSFLDSVPTATLLLEESSGTMYFLFERLGKKKLLVSDRVFSSYHQNDRSRVVMVTGEDLRSIGDIAVVKSSQDARVYLLDHTKGNGADVAGEKRVFANERAFLSRGYEWSDIGVVSQIDLDNYRDGAIIP